MFLRGEDINIGFGVENPAARLTKVAPQAFIPGRTPTGVDVDVTKVLMKETKGTGISTKGSEIVQRKASGSLEFNVRSESIGYLLKSLLGKSTPTVVLASVINHKFEVLDSDPQFPTLTMALSQRGSFQDYSYKGAMVSKLEIKTPVDDLVNAKADFFAADETKESAYSFSTNDTDYLFRPQDITVKVAADVAGLAAGVELKLKALSLVISNNSKPQQTIGSLIPTDAIAGLIEVSGEMEIDYEDDTYHEMFKTGAYKALEITIERSDIDYDMANNHPKMVITLPKISIEKSTPQRPMDDVVRDKLGFNAHYSDDDSEAIEINLQNTVTDYEYDVIS